MASCLPVGFWLRVAAAPARLLMLDYDGTLAPFTEQRLEARPLPRARALLVRIASESATRVVIVSGRRALEVVDLLGPLDATIVGEHGWERYHPHHGLEQRPLPEPMARALQHGLDLARQIGAPDLERKRCSLVLHTRSLRPADSAAITHAMWQVWTDLAHASGLRLERIHGGLELRAPQRSKGDVVCEWTRGGATPAFAVFIGDDQTDEDAFRAIEPGGVGIRVGSDNAATSASAVLGSCADVVEFLHTWLDVAATDREAP